MNAVPVFQYPDGTEIPRLGQGTWYLGEKPSARKEELAALRTGIECGMTHEEASQESSRCLRCDQFGYGIFKGGRVEKW